MGKFEVGEKVVAIDKMHHGNAPSVIFEPRKIKKISECGQELKLKGATGWWEVELFKKASPLSKPKKKPRRKTLQAEIVNLKSQLQAAHEKIEQKDRLESDFLNLTVILNEKNNQLEDQVKILRDALVKMRYEGSPCIKIPADHAINKANKIAEKEIVGLRHVGEKKA